MLSFKQSSTSMNHKDKQNFDLFGYEYNDNIKALTDKYGPKVPLVNSLYSRFKKYYDPSNWEPSESQHNFLNKLNELIQSLYTHLLLVEGKPIYLAFTNHSYSKDMGENNITVKIGFMDHTTKCLWGAFSMHVDDPVMCYCLTNVFPIKLSSYITGPETELIVWKKPKLYRFHPERFASTRPESKNYTNFYNSEVKSNSGLLTMDQLNKLTRYVVNGLNKAASNYPLKDRLDSNQSLIYSSEIALSMSYGRFASCGRQIFQFSKDLTEMLNQTGNDDIQMGHIKLPYNSLYLYFGPQDNLSLKNGWLVDGAYIESRGDSGNFRITLTSVPLDTEQTKYWFNNPEPYYSQDLIGDYADKNLKEVISIIYKESIDSIAATKSALNAESKKILTENNILAIDTTEKNKAIRLEEQQQKFPIYQSALTLIVNALCYITGYKEDIEYKYTDDVPKILIDTVRSAKNPAKAEQKLKLEGYSKVHICGENIAAKAGISTQQRSKEVHWRRGHWRNQPYGENRALIKLKWIMPMLIGVKNKDSNNTPLQGHIYEVE